MGFVVVGPNDKMQATRKFIRPTTSNSSQIIFNVYVDVFLMKHLVDICFLMISYG